MTNPTPPNPGSPTPTSAPQAGASLIPRLINNRAKIALGVLGIGLLVTIAGLVLAIVMYSQRPDLKSTDGDKTAQQEKASEKPKKEPMSVDYFPTSVWLLSLGLEALALGAWLYFSPPKPEEADNFMRVWLLSITALVGLSTALFGMILAYRWQLDLYDWIDKGETRKGRWLVLALAITFAGLLLMFFGMQPVRTEERKSVVLRRMFYGYNTFLSGFLLLILLIIVNVATQMQMTRRLDVTASGLHTLKKESQEYLKDVKQPIQAYLVMSEREPYVRRTGFGPEMAYPTIYADTKMMLDNVEEACKTFKFRTISPSTERAQVSERFKDLELEPYMTRPQGIILVSGDESNKDTRRISFIPWDELVAVGENQQKLQFVGEGRLMREIEFLETGKLKPIIYFTQGHGEPDVTIRSQQERRAKPGERTAIGLLDYLASNNFEVRPLRLDPGSLTSNPNPSLADATAVVILSPLAQFSPEAERVLKNYLLPSGGRQGGKLLAFLPPTGDPATRTVGTTNLEQLFQELGIDVRARIVVSQPRGPNFSPTDVIPTPASERLPANHPLQTLIAGVLFKIPNVRPIEAIGTPPGGLQSVPVLISPVGVTAWEEERLDINYREMWNAIQNDLPTRQAKQPRDRISLAVAVWERANNQERPRALVFGSDFFVADREAARVSDPTASFRTFRGSLDWLRERPSSMNIEARESPTFQITKKNVDETAMIYNPVLLTLFGVIGLGIGIWVIRRN